MATKFEFIFPIEKTVKDRDGKEKLWNLDSILAIVDSKNCRYIIAEHPEDSLSDFRHWHVGISTTSDNTYETIAKWFNMPTNSCQRIKKRFDTTYALYLIHYNQGEKTEIDPNSVIRNFDLDYAQLIKNIENKIKDDELLDKLALGQITEYELYRTVPVDWLRKHKRDIDIALQVRSKTHMVQEEERNMEVVYITGDARCGKSYLAKRLCKENGFSYYFTANGQNPFDDYMGQDAVILDDVRPSDFKFSELLKILDNHMSSKVSARYHNIDLNCKVIYMTTIKPIDEFYKELQEHSGEASEQLRGRINTLVKVKKDTVSLYVLNSDNLGYSLLGKIPNPILYDEDIQLMSEEDRKKKAVDMLGGLGSMLTNTAKIIGGEVPSDFVQDVDDDTEQISFDTDPKSVPF